MNDEKKKWNIGIGFVTGRKNFRRVLTNYVLNCIESGLFDSGEIGLNLFVAYDLDYNHTRRSDFVAVNPEISKWLDSIHFYGYKEIEEIKGSLLHNKAIGEKDLSILFHNGYSGKRNIILLEAIQSHMDCLLFVDDDEYPLALTKGTRADLWSGQHVLKTHLDNIREADITFGHHCGYISPIPCVDFSDGFREETFRKFIESLSNDILNWKNVKKAMNHGGVTYAENSVLRQHRFIEVSEKNHAKFISGSNLCINLSDPLKVFPFYNPPGARGEDTFLSTCLSDRKVLKVPCYTFHDGFGEYRYLLSGVLPIKLKKANAESPEVAKRFYKACIGWIRYKPLYIYITDNTHYRERIEEIDMALTDTIPSICKYFRTDAFMNIPSELHSYDQTVKKQYNAFEKSKHIWDCIMKTM